MWNPVCGAGGNVYSAFHGYLCRSWAPDCQWCVNMKRHTASYAARPEESRGRLFPEAEVILPKVLAVMLLVGVPKFGWFVEPCACAPS